MKKHLIFAVLGLVLLSGCEETIIGSDFPPTSHEQPESIPEGPRKYCRIANGDCDRLSDEIQEIYTLMIRSIPFVSQPRSLQYLLIQYGQALHESEMNLETMTQDQIHSLFFEIVNTSKGQMRQYVDFVAIARKF